MIASRKVERIPHSVGSRPKEDGSEACHAIGEGEGFTHLVEGLRQLVACVTKI